jgi:hypothetical protein
VDAAARLFAAGGIDAAQNPVSLRPKPHRPFMAFLPDAGSAGLNGCEHFAAGAGTDRMFVVV